MPSYLRERYSSTLLAGGGTGPGTPAAPSRAGSSRSSAYGSPMGASALDDDEDDGQPECVDIFVSSDESRRCVAAAGAG